MSNSWKDAGNMSWRVVKDEEFTDVQLAKMQLLPNRVYMWQGTEEGEQDHLGRYCVGMFVPGQGDRYVRKINSGPRATGLTLVSVPTIDEAIHMMVEPEKFGGSWGE